MVAILPTGNELVEPEQSPAPGQIRNSNGLLLASAVRAGGGAPMLLPIARDDEADLREKISRGLESDVLVLSGGVSAGVMDLVPRVLADLGVEQIFHKLNLKPGKPLWFGVARRGKRPTLVFGLPGNPMSSFVCCELFVRPAIARMVRGRTGSQHPGTRSSSPIFNSAAIGMRSCRPFIASAMTRSCASARWPGAARPICEGWPRPMPSCHCRLAIGCFERAKPSRCGCWAKASSPLENGAITLAATKDVPVYDHRGDVEADLGKNARLA